MPLRNVKILEGTLKNTLVFPQKATFRGYQKRKRAATFFRGSKHLYSRLPLKSHSVTKKHFLGTSFKVIPITNVCSAEKSVCWQRSNKILLIAQNKNAYYTSSVFHTPKAQVIEAFSHITYSDSPHSAVRSSLCNATTVAGSMVVHTLIMNHALSQLH